MKKSFTKQYIIDNKGCYSIEQVEVLKCINNKKITLKQLFGDLPIKDFSWFLVKKCDLTTSQKQLFALHCAKQVLTIYEKEHPKDSRVRDCIDATERFINNDCNLKELREKRDAAAYAGDAAYAADVYAADAYAAYAAAYAAYAAAADVYAADAAAAYAYRESVWEFVKSIM